MERELDAVRKRGYAISEGEFERGLVGLAAPVREDGTCVAALCISGPEYRLDREAAGALAPLCIAYAGELERSLGRPPA